MKLLVIGLDGFGFEHWHHFMPSGWQPRELHSPNPSSGPAWTSIYTGVRPEEHGVLHVWGKKDLAYPDCKTHADIKKNCLWNVLYAHGVTCDIYGMPITWPASAVRPRFVSGFWQGGFSNWCYPMEKEPDKRHLRWSDVIWWVSDNPGDCMNWMKRIVDSMTTKGFLAQLEECTKMYTSEFLATHEDADLTMVGYTFFDRACHLWYDDVIETVGVLARDIVERLVEKLKPEKVLVVSDHGFGPGTQTTCGHTKRGIIAGYGFAKWQPYDYKQFQTWDAAPIIAGVFGVDWKTAPRESEEVDEATLLERFRAMGYVQ